MDFTKYDWDRYRPSIFCKMHFLLISENDFFHRIKRDGITSLHGIYDVQLVVWAAEGKTCLGIGAL